jgi:hypothetical protein
MRLSPLCVPWARGAASLALIAGCKDDDARVSRDAAVEAKVEADPVRTERLGCARAGAIEAIEKDPTSIVDAPQPRDELNWARVRTSLTADVTTVIPGGAIPLRVSISSIDKVPLAVLLEAEVAGSGSRRDTSLLQGYPGDGGGPTQALAFPMPVRTFDARDYDVDRIPMLQPPTPPQRVLYRVTLPPRGVLTKTFVWVAYGIPPPAPPFFDDAGRRWVPKTQPSFLSEGTYTIRVELPLYRAPSEIASASTHIDVKRAQ